MTWDGLSFRGVALYRQGMLSTLSQKPVFPRGNVEPVAEQPPPRPRDVRDFRRVGGCGGLYRHYRALRHPARRRERLHFLWRAIVFLRPDARDVAARKLFLASITYLPLVLGALVADRLIAS